MEWITFDAPWWELVDHPLEEQIHERECEQDRVEAVEDAAVAGDELTCILDLHPSLDRRLCKIAESCGDREDDGEQRDLPGVDTQAEEVVKQHDGRDAARPT